MRALALALVALPVVILGASSRAHAGSDEQKLLQAGDALMQRAQHTPDLDERYRLADLADTSYRAAAAQAPKDPEPHLRRASALQITDPQHPEQCRPRMCELAVEELARASKLDGAGIEAQAIASELGILYSRLKRFEEALAEYDRALHLAESERYVELGFEPIGVSESWSNSAETLMALGRLDEAIARYRRSEETAVSELQRALADWGLGVALDRDEQGDKARQAIERAVAGDPNMTHLKDPSVFFEPPGDKLYYLALGHEVQDDVGFAIENWRAYLALPNPRWAARAKVHLRALEQRKAEIDRNALVTVSEAVQMRAQRSPVELRDELSRRLDELRLCYARTLRQQKVRGEAQLELEVTPGGWVRSRPRVFDTNFESASLVQCIELTARNWRFSAVDGVDDETLIVPLHFGPLP